MQPNIIIHFHCALWRHLSKFCAICTTQKCRNWNKWMISKRGQNVGYKWSGVLNVCLQQQQQQQQRNANSSSNNNCSGVCNMLPWQWLSTFGAVWQTYKHVRRTHTGRSISTHRISWNADCVCAINLNEIIKIETRQRRSFVGVRLTQAENEH